MSKTGGVYGITFENPMTIMHGKPGRAVGLWSGDKTTAPAESVYKPNVDDYEVIGITGSTTYSWSADATGMTWVHPVGAEWTERADSAELAIRNDSGATRVMYGVTVWGTPVLRLSGKNGFIHDDYVDYEAIGREGEQAIEIGNNYIVSADQTNRVANWWWRNIRSKKHIYSVRIPGFCSFYEVGEWYVLRITSTRAWNVEAVDFTVECIEVQCDLRAGDIGDTVVVFREVYQNWVFDDSATVARYRAGIGSVKALGREIRVAAANFPGEAHFYCDGIADEFEIRQAVDHLYAIGGGAITCVGGDFNITSTVTLYDNMTLEVTAGSRLVRNGNCYVLTNYYGGINDAKNICVHGRGTITRDPSDHNSAEMLVFTHTDNLLIDGLAMTNPCYYPILILYCAGKVSNCFIDGEDYVATANYTGIYVSTGDRFVVSGNTIKRLNCSGGGAVGIGVNGNECEITDNIIESIGLLDGAYGASRAIQFGGNHNEASRNRIKDIGAVNAYCYGVYVQAGEGNVVQYNFVSDCTGPGIKVDTDSLGARVIGNTCFDNYTLMAHGDFEASANTPHVVNDGAVLQSCTFVQSAAQKHAGSASFIFTKTIASGTGAYAYVVDNNFTTDMHGLSILQGSYFFTAWFYVATAAAVCSEVGVIVSRYSSGAWADATAVCSATYGAWQPVGTTLTLTATTTGTRLAFFGSTALASAASFYVDDVELIPLGFPNQHENNFNDDGVGTMTG